MHVKSWLDRKNQWVEKKLMDWTKFFEKNYQTSHSLERKILKTPPPFSLLPKNPYCSLSHTFCFPLHPPAATSKKTSFLSFKTKHHHSYYRFFNKISEPLLTNHQAKTNTFTLKNSNSICLKLEYQTRTLCFR